MILYQQQPEDIFASCLLTIINSKRRFNPLLSLVYIF